MFLFKSELFLQLSTLTKHLEKITSAYLNDSTQFNKESAEAFDKIFTDSSMVDSAEIELSSENPNVYKLSFHCEEWQLWIRLTLSVINGTATLEIIDVVPAHYREPKLESVDSIEKTCFILSRLNYALHWHNLKQQKE